MSGWSVFSALVCFAVLVAVRVQGKLRPEEVVHIAPIDITGPTFHLYTPFHKLHHSKGGGLLSSRPAADVNYVRPLMTTPEHWIQSLTERHKHLDQITTSTTELAPASQRALRAYLDMLRSFLLGDVYGRAEKSIVVGGDWHYTELNATLRSLGEDMSYLGTTMVGTLRMQILEDLIVDVINRNVPGDFLETGVWRGGCSAYAAAVIRAYTYVRSVLKTGTEAVALSANRRVIFCDSFSGLPPGDATLHERDVGWDKLSYVKASEEEVSRHLQEFNLMDPRILFAKGFFNESMIPLRTKVFQPEKRTISILRLDGDMYQSTVDVLYNLYEHVAIGGYIIVDDWTNFPAKDACEDFFRVHKMQVKVTPIDHLSVYFQKTKEVKVQYWRYEKKQYK